MCEHGYCDQKWKDDGNGPCCSCKQEQIPKCDLCRFVGIVVSLTTENMIHASDWFEIDCPIGQTVTYTFKPIKDTFCSNYMLSVCFCDKVNTIQITNNKKDFLIEDIVGYIDEYIVKQQDFYRLEKIKIRKLILTNGELIMSYKNNSEKDI